MKREEINLNNIEELLIVVDMNNGFVNKGAMADPYIRHIIPEIRGLVEYFLNAPNTVVAYLNEKHKKNSKEFNKYPAHCIDGTEEAEYVEELKLFENDCFLFGKNSTSGIFAPKFMNFIKDISKQPKFKKVVIVGCCTDICVMNLALPLVNFFDQIDVEVETIIPENAVETYQIKPNIYNEHGVVIEEGIHDRKEYTKMANKLMTQGGVKLVKKYERGIGNGK